MNFCLVTCWLDNYHEMAVTTVIDNKGEYCERHGYGMASCHKARPAYRNCIHGEGITWERLALAIEVLETGKYDWVWVVGTDTVLTNMTIPLTERIVEGMHVVISPDWAAPVQADSFLVRNSPEGIGWLKDVLGQFDRLRLNNWVENQAMIDLLPKYRPIMAIVPQRLLNAYEYSIYKEMYADAPKKCDGRDVMGNDGQWQEGDFLIHFPSIAYPKRMKLIREWMGKVVR